MANTTPEQAAADWAARLAQSSDKIARGVRSVSMAPGQAAARQKGAYVANVQAAADKWASNVASVSLGEWQEAAITKGVPRIAAGAQAAQGKMAATFATLLPHVDRTRASLPARGNLEQNIARSAAFARGMATYKKR